MLKMTFTLQLISTVCIFLIMLLFWFLFGIWTFFLNIVLFVVAYIIWYGTWTVSAKNIILNFVQNVGTTAWWRINYAYGGVGPLCFGKAVHDAYSQGTYLSNPWQVVQDAFNNNLLPKDINGIYLVISSR